jgi:hypothetical protein
METQIGLEHFRKIGSKKKKQKTKNKKQKTKNCKKNRIAVSSH